MTISIFITFTKIFIIIRISFLPKPTDTVNIYGDDPSIIEQQIIEENTGNTAYP